MESLPGTHKDINAAFHKGEFTVQCQNQYGFSKIACDQLIEQTLNKDSKTKGGLTGITLNKGAVNRWILSHHHRAAIAKECKAMVGQDSETKARKELSEASIDREEAQVQAIVSTIESMVDPFSYEGEDLINISSGIVAPVNVKDDLQHAFEMGKSCAEKFVADRIRINGNLDFFAPLKRNKLKTFATTATATKLTSTTVNLKCCEQLFARLLIIGKTRNVDLHHLLTYALTTVPASLGTGDGQLLKTVKSKIMHEVESVAQEVELKDVPQNSALIIDGMAIIQMMGTVPCTFSALAHQLLGTLISFGKYFKSERIDFVIDRYPQVSIKNCERSRRAATGLQIVQITRPEQRTPKQFKKFLSSGQNKEELIEFLFSEWKKCDAELLGNIELFVCHRNFCHSFRSVNNVLVVEEVKELTNDHEEADTRLLLHAKHASQTYSAILIKSPDTDVMLLSLAFSCEISSSVFFVTGTGNNARIVNVTSLSESYGTLKSQALLGLHVFTGCDSVSAFRGKGKVKAIKIMFESQEFCEAFAGLGRAWEITEQLLSILERFVCSLYGQKTCSSVNEARYFIFKLRCSNDAGLPPNQDCLKQHVLRANFQCAIYRRSLLQTISSPSPAGRGWKLEAGNELLVHWMDDVPAPENVLKTVHCSCKKMKCVGRTCSCKNADLQCTDLCGCIDCSNNVDICEEINSGDDYLEDDSCQEN